MKAPATAKTLKLKLCPFCGVAPECTPWHGGRSTKVFIQCRSENCKVNPAVTGETPTAAAREWNRRNVDDMHDIELNDALAQLLMAGKSIEVALDSRIKIAAVAITEFV